MKTTCNKLNFSNNWVYVLVCFLILRKAWTTFWLSVLVIRSEHPHFMSFNACKIVYASVCSAVFAKSSSCILMYWIRIDILPRYCCLPMTIFFSFFQAHQLLEYVAYWSFLYPLSTLLLLICLLDCGYGRFSPCPSISLCYRYTFNYFVLWARWFCRDPAWFLWR